MEMNCGGWCSPGCTCILRRNLVGTLLSFIHSLNASKPSAARNSVTSPNTHLKQKGWFLSSLWLKNTAWAYGKHLNLEKKFLEIENPPIKPSFGCKFLKKKLDTLALPELWPGKPQNWLWFCISVLW